MKTHQQAMKTHDETYHKKFEKVIWKSVNFF